MASGGTDSLIGIWDLDTLLLRKTISNNDFKVINIDLSFDGKYIAGIFEDEISEKFSIEIYDV